MKIPLLIVALAVVAGLVHVPVAYAIPSMSPSQSFNIYARMLVQARHNAFNSTSRHRHHHQLRSNQQLHTVLQILAILHVSSYNNNNNSSQQLHTVLQILAILHVSSYNNSNSRPVRLQTVHKFFYFALMQKLELEID